MAGLAKLWMEMQMENGIAKVVLETGEEYSGFVHYSYRNPNSRKLVGRAIDLKRACKQLAIAPSMASVAVICLSDPRNQGPRFFLLRALPFGARNAVFTFGAVARALEMILVGLFSFLLEQYVDDFPQLEPEALTGGGIQPMDVLATLC